ncbi:MAG TPA: hypothetical protein VEA37_13315 [Flavobacterium sp.]|nr:hypothetical protein [Flavobacterium sp.]
MIKISKQFPKIPLLLSLLLLALSCLVYFFLYKNILDNNRIFEEAEAKWQAQNSEEEKMKSLEHSLESLEQERALLNAHFVRSSDVVPFLDTIETLAPKAGASAGVASVAISPDGSSLLVGVKATGSFENLYKFLTLLENSPYQLEFTSMNMTKTGVGASSSSDSSEGNWTASFGIRLLSFVN